MNDGFRKMCLIAAAVIPNAVWCVREADCGNFSDFYHESATRVFVKEFVLPVGCSVSLISYIVDASELLSCLFLNGKGFDESKFVRIALHLGGISFLVASIVEKCISRNSSRVNLDNNWSIVFDVIGLIGGILSIIGDWLKNDKTECSGIWYSGVGLILRFFGAFSLVNIFLV